MAQDALRLPPQDLPAERSVLGSIMLYGECLDDVAAVIVDQDFYLESHQIVYRALLSLHNSGTGIDAVTVSDELSRLDKLEWIGGDEYLMRLVESVPHAAHAEFHARIVRGKSVQRAIIYAASEMLHQAYLDNVDTADLVHQADTQIGKLIETTSKNTSKTLRAIALTALDRLTSPREEGIKLGFNELDDILLGAKPGQVIVLAARPGVGKSAFAANICRKVSRYQGVLFCSIEMPEDELLDRALVSDMGVSLAELRPLARDDVSRGSVVEALQTLSDLPVTIDDSPDQTIGTIGQQARLARRKHGLGLIIVDYLQIVRSDKPKESREQQVAAISWGLKRLAKQLHVPIIALAQLNREIEKRPDKTPRLSDLRESGAIEQNANVVLLLDRPGNWDSDRPEDEAFVYISKNRGGRTGKVDLKWDGRSATFSDPEFLPAGFSAADYPQDMDYFGQ